MDMTSIFPDKSGNQTIKMVTKLPYKGNESQFNTKLYHLIVQNMCGTQPLHLQGAESLYLYIYKVLNPYTSTFIRCRNLTPLHLQGVESLYLYIDKMLNPYTSTFTRCRIPIPLY